MESFGRILFVMSCCLVGTLYAQTSLPRNIRPVICKVPNTDMDLCVNADCTTVAAGVTACICRQGMIPNQFSDFECIDFNECAYYQDVCRAGRHGQCINQIGDYKCLCDSTYYVTAGNEHYCQRKSMFDTPFGQFMFYNAIGGDF